jgi:hypothetical protein
MDERANLDQPLVEAQSLDTFRSLDTLKSNENGLLDDQPINDRKRLRLGRNVNEKNWVGNC